MIVGSCFSGHEPVVLAEGNHSFTASQYVMSPRICIFTCSQYLEFHSPQFAQKCA